MLCVSLVRVPWNRSPCTRAYANRSCPWEATLMETRFTSGFWTWSVTASAYAGNFAQSLKSPSIWTNGDGPVGEGESMLARIGTNRRSVTTAEVAMRVHYQRGQDRI